MTTFEIKSHPADAPPLKFPASGPHRMRLPSGPLSRMTSYKNPSITARLAASDNVVDHHRLFFKAIQDAADASATTKHEWEKVYLNRQLELMLAAPDAGTLCFQYNFIKFTVGLHPAIAVLFELAFTQRAKQLPSPTEQLLASGVTLEGFPK